MAAPAKVTATVALLWVLTPHFLKLMGKVLLNGRANSQALGCFHAGYFFIWFCTMSVKMHSQHRALCGLEPVVATASSGLQPHLCSRSMHLCTSMRRNRHLLSLQISWQLIKAAFQLLFITKHVSSPWNSELKLGCRRRSFPKYTLEMYGCIQQVFPNKWNIFIPK